MSYTDKIEQIISNTFFNAKINAYQTLLNDIDAHDYTTISEIKCAIKIELDSIDRLMAAEKYEAEAKADHASSEQFNHE